MKKSKNIIIGVTGGIASYKTADLVRLLKKDNFDVTCVMTKEAVNFITPLTLQYLSGNKVYLDLFDLPEDSNPAHISLAKKADLIVVIPATAHTIAKLAYGLCDDLLSLTVLDSRAPVLICPAMHETMYNKEIVQNNIAALKKRGFHFIGPIKGALLSGREGLGRLENIQSIFKEIKRLVK